MRKGWAIVVASRFGNSSCGVLWPVCSESHAFSHTLDGPAFLRFRLHRNSLVHNKLYRYVRVSPGTSQPTTERHPKTSQVLAEKKEAAGPPFAQRPGYSRCNKLSNLTLRRLKKVVDKLRELQRVEADYNDFVEALKRLGQEAAKRGT